LTILPVLVLVLLLVLEISEDRDQNAEGALIAEYFDSSRLITFRCWVQ
jgi:hypothetical protein